MPESRTKTFDAVEMSRRLREQTSRKLATLTREQRIALLNRQIPVAGNALPEDEPILREDPPAYGRKASE
jgi:hypothetical protein